jgi:hypothetical protein
VSAFDLGDIPPDFFDHDKCMMRNAMLVKYVGSLIPRGHSDIKASADQIARCLWIDARVRELAFNYPEEFPTIDSVYKMVSQNMGRGQG